MSSLEEITRGLIKLLQDNVTDPEGRTEKVDFIRYEHPRLVDEIGRPLPTQLPIISFELVRSREDTFEIGDRGRRYFLRYDLEIYVRGKKEYTIDGVKYQGQKLLFFLLDQVQKTFLQNRSYLKSNYNVEDFEFRRISTWRYIRTLDCYRGSLELEVSVIIPKA